MKKLTDKQWNALVTIRTHWQQNGFAPTFRELGHILGIATTPALDRCRALRRAGLVDWDGNRKRTLRLTKAGEEKFS